ncbi:MAG TPA: histidine kinase [Gammaproteobacteria bacterium]|nr:histidine kinase [Gammaproteobacteria bacterium]
MATLPVERPGQGFASHSRRAGSGWRLVALFQLAFWSVFAAAFFLVVRPNHPFGDILLRQTAAATAIGLACSALLERLQAPLHARNPRLAIFVAAPLGSVLLGLVWYELAKRASDAINPFVWLLVSLPGNELFAPQQRPAFPAVLLLWNLLFLALMHLRDQQAQKERVLRAETLTHEAQLRMLRYQLNPHFLFNALNSIGALGAEAPQRVQRMVGELSGFLRYSLLDPQRLEVPLGEELRAVTHYLEVEKVRFEDDLEVSIELDATAAQRTLPAFLVLPLVENAVKHGQHTSAMPLKVHVTGRIEGGALLIEVKNTGRWTTPSSTRRSDGTDTGLENVRQRLLEHYPGRHTFDVAESNGWVCARIRIDDDG